MISFAQPWVLLLLVIPAALAAWEWFRRAGAPGRVLAPTDFDADGQTDGAGDGADTARALRRLRGIGWSRVLAAAGLVPLGVLAAAIILLAGPQRLGPPKQERALTNIEIVLDVSGSMASPLGNRGAAGGFNPWSRERVSGPDSRYGVAMEAIREFLTARKGDAFGLTIFGGDVVRWVPLTRDLNAIRAAGPYLDPLTMPAPLQSTRVANALSFSMGTLRRVGASESADANANSRGPAGDKLIVLITDGESPDLDGGAAGRIGQELRDAGIVLQAIHVGDGAPPAQLAEAAVPTGGRVHSAQDRAGLRDVFAFIDRMQPAQVRSKRPEPIDFFAPFALVGLALLGLHQLCLLGLRWTPW